VNKLVLFVIGAGLSVPIMAVILLLGIALTHAGMWIADQRPERKPDPVPITQPKKQDCLACRFAYPDRWP
jgi:hypothetical protein